VRNVQLIAAKETKLVMKESILIRPQSHLLYLTRSYRYEGILRELVNAAPFSCPVLAHRVISVRSLVAIGHSGHRSSSIYE
jgi:hypothetical protein